jgi:membrane protease YdiL (CAAX protease family)
MKLLKDTAAVVFVFIYFLCIGTRYIFDKINIHNTNGFILILAISAMLAIVYYAISNKLFNLVFKPSQADIPPSNSLWLNITLVIITFIISLVYCSIKYGLKPINIKLIQYLPPTIILAYAEEIVFRKYLLTILLKYTSKWPALLLSSLFFASVHFPYGIQRVIISFSLGLLFAYFYTKTKNLVGTATAHSLWNIMVQNSYSVF